MEGHHHFCPKCGGTLDRIHRNSLDRLVSRFYRVHRYSCRNKTCGREGLLHRPRERKPIAAAPRTMLVIVVLLGLACVVTVICCM